METQRTANNRTAQKNVHTIFNDKLMEYLKKGIVPWHVDWRKAGIPTNLLTRNPYRGINVMLLAALGYERNLFLTEKQLKEIDGAIKPGERPNIVVYWNNQKKEGETETSTEPRMRFYTLYNVSQCVGISLEMMESAEVHPIEMCAEIVERMPHQPTIRHKEAAAYYDPTVDVVNIPKQGTFKNDADYYAALLHQLVHSTGHHTRLDRMGLVQMPEFGCSPFTMEELVAEIATSYLLSYVGAEAVFYPTSDYLTGWLEKFQGDRYFIFNAASLAQKAVDFIFDINGVEDAEMAKEDVEGTIVA